MFDWVGFMKSLFICSIILIGLVLSTPADIVWNGARVSQWPTEALPELQNQTSQLAKTTVTSVGMGLYPQPKGVVKGLTLLIDFSDQQASVTKGDVEDWLNKPGFNIDGCNGSVRDYYKAASNGMVDYQNTVLGFYRAKNTKAYYDGGTDYSRASELLNEVLDYFDSQVNFADYDNDGDGNTEAISIVYSGAGAVWGKGIWPHSGWVGKKRDGVNITRYMMTDLPGKFSLYVFAHESGHMIFGWPDLYWFGDYCLMGNRMHDLNPVVINDFFRADQGWIPFVDVNESSNGVFTSTVNETAYRFKNPTNSKEGFFWSNIANTGRYSSLKGSGLLLFHYNLQESGNTSADNLRIRIVQADNKADLQAQQWPSPGNASNDLFRSNTSAEFSANTSNYADWYDKTPSNLRIWNISSAQITMNYKLGVDPIPTLIRAIPKNAMEQQNSGNFWNLLGQRRSVFAH